MATKKKSVKKKLTKAQLDRLKIHGFINIYADDEHKENILLADGLDEAFIGLAHRDGQHGAQVAVYGIFGCIHALVKQNKWDWVEAEEYFNFNTRYAYVGEYTPMFIEDMPR
jgi:hypothetical protein